MSGKSWHAMEAEEVLQTLQTSRKGLSQEEAANRLEKYGPNKLREEKKVSPLSLFFDQFKNTLVIMLIIAALISGIILEEYTDATLITIIVIMNAILGFVQEYRAEKAMEALKKMTARRAIVVRDGREEEIDSEKIVPGDILLLEAGDLVSADARLLETVELRADEAPLTGESTPVAKDVAPLVEDTQLADRANTVFMGTTLVNGRGVATVVTTGMNTEFGNIAGLVQKVEEEVPPIKVKVERLGRQLGLAAIVACVFAALVNILMGRELVEVFLTAVTLAVSAVPEGLPAVITVTLAIGAARMARSRAIVRKLASVETLGSTTVICSDKTGTLTQNEMTVRRLYANGEVDVTGTGYEPKGDFLRDGDEIKPRDDKHLELLMRIGLLCNNSRLEASSEKYRIIGDPTEGALVVVAAKAVLQREDVEKMYPRVAEIPFESSRKRMSTVHTTPDGKRVAYVKGAPEVIVELCSGIYENGKVRKLEQEDRECALEVTRDMASDALRVLAMAYKELPENTGEYKEEVLERELVFVGLTGMIDPPRKEVPVAVKLCKKAGIKSVMITGDHKLTAVAVAREIGMLEGSEESKVLSGVELDAMSDEELEKVADDVVVYARTSPTHKMCIAQALKKRGHVVAMTGDGINDAPAIKTADIGIAMGIKGTEVTKEASDMVLTDDNFATIVGAVEAGRHIYDNIRKFVRLMLAVNFDEILEVTVAALIGIPMPLIPIHILWINLVTDGLPALALSVDPKEPDIMSRPPRKPGESLLHGLLGFILFAAMLDFCSDFFPFMWLWYTTHDLIRARTIAFTIVVIYEFILAYNCRSETHSVLRLGWKGLVANKLLFLSVVAGLFLQLLIIYVPFLQPVFHTTALSSSDWVIVLVCAGIGFAVLPEVFIFH